MGHCQPRRQALTQGADGRAAPEILGKGMLAREAYYVLLCHGWLWLTQDELDAPTRASEVAAEKPLEAIAPISGIAGFDPEQELSRNQLIAKIQCGAGIGVAD